LWLVVVVHLLLHLLLLSHMRLANWHAARRHELLLLHHSAVHALGLLDHQRLSQNVDEIGVLKVVEQDIKLSLAQAPRLEEVLSRVGVETHLLGLHEELFSLVDKVFWDHTWLHSIRPHGKLLLDLPTLLFSPWERYNIVLAHPIEELSWDFHEDFPRQEVGVAFEILEGDELDDVCGHVFAVGRRVESLLVTVELIHRCEVSLTDSHDDDSHGTLGSTDNLIN